MFKKISQSTIVDSPTLFITKNRQRLKQFGDKVYLNNNDEFELEIFNPIKNKIKALISINGIDIGEVVIRPGQRAFLERFLTENKKFLFQTYTVENNNQSVDNAIRNNGKVTIKFFNLKKERFNVYDYIQTTSTITTNNNPYFTLNNSNFITTDSFFSSSVNNEIPNKPKVKRFISPQSNILGGSNSRYNVNNKQENDIEFKETGTIEKGSVSSQSFIYDDSEFELFAFKTISWQILPQSQKINTIDEITHYCGNCGSKRKKTTHMFCPHCGTKY